MSSETGSSMPSARRVLGVTSHVFYTRADLHVVRRLGGLVWLVTGLLAVPMLLSAAPTEVLGSAGPAVAALILLAGVLWGGFLTQTARQIGPGAMLFATYALAGGVGFLWWLAGLQGAYEELLLLPCLYAATSHPPRRALPLVAFVVLLTFGLALSGGWQPDVATEALAHVLLWCGVAFLAMVFTAQSQLQGAALRKREDEARRLARMDALTGLPNRRLFDELLSGEIARCRREGGALSLVVVDVDGFKRINDRYGHVDGDSCLRQVAGALRTAVRGSDRCFRWGGDEFAIVLPGGDLEVAGGVAARAAATVAQTCRNPDGHALSISCGSAEWSDGTGIDDLVEMADERLLEAKSLSVESRRARSAV